MSKPKTLREGIQRRFAGVLANLHTMLPGVVESYNSTTGRADVAPCMGYGTVRGGKRIVRFRSTISDVPVGFFGTGGAVVQVDVAAGDEVLLLFSEGSLRPWKARRGGKKLDPISDARFQLEDAIAIPLVIHSLKTCGIKISGGKIYLGDQVVPFVETPGPLNEGVVTGKGIDSFTGTPYSLLGNASTKVFAK